MQEIGRPQNSGTYCNVKPFYTTYTMILFFEANSNKIIAVQVTKKLNTDEINRLSWLFDEARLLEIAADHPGDEPRYFQTWATELEVNTNLLAKSQGYKAIRFGFEMERDLSEPFPEAPMPEGLEVRPVEEDQIRKIFDASQAAFRDHWGYREETWEEFKGWMEDPTFTPEIWKIAWDGDQVAGIVMNYVNENENEEYDRKRGYTENISVGRPWRKRGLAKSLIVQSMKIFKEKGFTQTALGVDAENTSGALQLYKGLGYKVTKKATTYRKEMRSQGLVI